MLLFEMKNERSSSSSSSSSSVIASVHDIHDHHRLTQIIHRHPNQQTITTVSVSESLCNLTCLCVTVPTKMGLRSSTSSSKKSSNQQEPLGNEREIVLGVSFRCCSILSIMYVSRCDCVIVATCMCVWRVKGCRHGRQSDSAMAE